MSTQNPPRLLDLAAKSLLRDGGVAVAGLEHLPAELFPLLFMEAFFGKHTESLQALVQAWPFSYLPLGGLMQLPQGRTLQATLDGLDLLLAQKVRPRRWKLQTLDLRNTGQNFWNLWSGAGAQGCSPTRPVAVESCRVKQPLASLEVLIDLCISDRIQDQFFTSLIGWAKQREGSLHLCCKTLKMFAVTMEETENVLALVHWGCVQEVEVHCTWSLSTLGKFAPYLGEMSHLQRLSLSHIYVPDSEEGEERHLSRFTSQILRLKHLRKLYLESPYFLMGRLDRLLRCLQTPLETLSITGCLFSESDLIYLSQCPNLSQLKDLDLSGVNFTGLSLEPLRALLEKVAATLQDLDLIFCGLEDSHVEAILPVLSRCHQLRVLSISGNLLSIATVEKLLHHTAGLHNLSLELYPAPLETYSSEGALELGTFARIRAELMAFLKKLGKPRTIWLSTSPCPHCGNKKFYDTEPVLCPCENPA
ncbi:PRAME family member 12-like [Molossus molossus]|uniref:PRAME family member 12-like n=1 Tax=Molossus molossus TaxID=27622 RepID=UPI001746F931|nr:PRAME family member 12-like [Molossus molossus]